MLCACWAWGVVFVSSLMAETGAHGLRGQQSFVRPRHQARRSTNTALSNRRMATWLSRESRSSWFLASSLSLIRALSAEAKESVTSLSLKARASCPSRPLEAVLDSIQGGAFRSHADVATGAQTQVYTRVPFKKKLRNDLKKTRAA